MPARPASLKCMSAQSPVIVGTPGLIPHHYGKAEARPGRKMGHVTRLFPKGALPGPFGVAAALGPLAGDPER